MTILEKLYEALKYEDVRDNVFETQEFRTVYDIFCDKYFSEDGSDNDKWEDFVEVIEVAQETAFKTGFKSAVKLIAD